MFADADENLKQICGGYIYQPNDTCDIARIDIAKSEGIRCGHIHSKKDINAIPHALNLLMSSRVFISTQ